MLSLPTYIRFGVSRFQRLSICMACSFQVNIDHQDDGPFWPGSQGRRGLNDDIKRHATLCRHLLHRKLCYGHKQRLIGSIMHILILLHARYSVSDVSLQYIGVTSLLGTLKVLRLFQPYYINICDDIQSNKKSYNMMRHTLPWTSMHTAQAERTSLIL